MAHLFSNPELRRATVVALLRIEGISILALGLFLIIKGLVDGGGIEWFVISGILALAIVGGLGLLLAAKGCLKFGFTFLVYILLMGKYCECGTV